MTDQVVDGFSVNIIGQAESIEWLVCISTFVLLDAY